MSRCASSPLVFFGVFVKIRPFGFSVCNRVCDSERFYIIKYGIVDDVLRFVFLLSVTPHPDYPKASFACLASHKRERTPYDFTGSEIYAAHADGPATD
jgi:hypothetical protein